MPRVSVVMPAYNAERYIQQAISSVLRQTFPDLELIIVDDGSTDSTLQLSEEASRRDRRVIVRAVQHLGVEGARNLGIEIASGDWVAFLDSDDYWLPTKLEAQLEFLEANPGVRLTSCYGRYVGPNGRRLGVVEIGPTSEDQYRRALLRHNPIWLLTSGSTCKRDDLLSAGGFDPSYDGAAEDLDLWTRLGERHLAVVLPHHLVCYRVSGGSASMLKYERIQLNAARVRVNTERRAAGKPVLTREEFERWFDELPESERRRSRCIWRSGFLYRQAGFHFIERKFVMGLYYLAGSLLAAPALPLYKLTRQLLPMLLRRARI
ncbi:MAG: glycosyltransferase family 2 protein [Symbiobacteriia bacterium]